MTTGRINQVTILNAVTRVAARPGGPRQSSSLRGAQSTQRVAARSRARRGRHAIHLPPLSSPRAVRGTSGRARAVPECSMHPARGGYRPPVTPRDGYQLRLTPKGLKVCMAIGQQPADSNSARRREPTGRQGLKTPSRPRGQGDTPKRKILAQPRW